MKLLVFGRSGQVATELARRMPVDVTAEFLGRDQVDLSDPASCSSAIMGRNVDAVINAAAWTAVDRAETEEAAATIINAATPGEMARACAERGMPFLHLSTDYVFDGAGSTPFARDDPTGPLSAYGRSKLAGEVAVRAAGGVHLILRTSWVFSAHGTNFVKTMLRLGLERDTLSVVSDQVGGPTPASAIADALIECASAMTRGGAGGTHHFAGKPDVSWAVFARAVMGEANLNCAIEDILSVEYQTVAPRPLNSRLDCSKFTEAFGIERPDWHLALRDVIKELGAIS